MKIDAYTTPGTERETRLSADELLRAMDSAGIDRAVIAPEDREIAVASTAGNQRMLDVARASGGRFIPACAANPWFGRASVDEVRRAAGEGARMLVVAPALQGFILTDEICDDLFAESARMNLPVYIHTGPHSSSAPAQLVLVAERFPQCRFILGHGGSTDNASDLAIVFRLKLPNIWFELSFIRPWGAANFAGQVDESRLIFGSSCPRNDLEFELSQFDVHWPVKDHPGTYGGNILKLIEEVRP